MSDAAPYLSVVQVAELLGMHPETVRKMVRERRLPAFKAGRSWRFDRDELMAWLRRQRDPDGGGRVLVVDDAAAVRDVVRITLEQAGHDVVVAETGEGAIAALDRAAVDLVVLDLRLPGLSGVEVMRHVRGRSAELPVIVITGYPDSELLSRALEHGPFVVLAKPVEPRALLEAVDGGLAAARLRPDS